VERGKFASKKKKSGKEGRSVYFWCCQGPGAVGLRGDGTRHHTVIQAKGGKNTVKTTKKRGVKMSCKHRGGEKGDKKSCDSLVRRVDQIEKTRSNPTKKANHEGEPVPW